PKKIIKMEELNRFYIPKTDGNAHANCLASLNQPTDVTLKQVVEGMVTYSSNANTDYLIYELGINSINHTLSKSELDSNDNVMTITCQLYIPVKIMNEGMRKDESFKHNESLSRKDYEESVLKAFEESCALNDTEAIKKELYSIMSMSFQKM